MVAGSTGWMLARAPAHVRLGGSHRAHLRADHAGELFGDRYQHEPARYVVVAVDGRDHAAQGLVVRRRKWAVVVRHGYHGSEKSLRYRYCDRRKINQKPKKSEASAARIVLVSSAARALNRIQSAICSEMCVRQDIGAMNSGVHHARGRVADQPQRVDTFVRACAPDVRNA